MIATTSETYVGLYEDIVMQVELTGEYITTPITATVPVPIQITSCKVTGFALKSNPLTALILVTQIPSKTETSWLA